MRIRSLFLAALFAAMPMAYIAAAEGEGKAVAGEAAEHPRLERSIKELRETVAMLEKAPHDFGGHKADAIKACKDAIEQLEKALEFRVEKEGKEGKDKK